MDKILLRVSEAAKLLSVSRWTIYRWLEEGRLEGTKIGRGSLRIFHASLDRLIQQNRIEDTESGGMKRNPNQRAVVKAGITVMTIMTILLFSSSVMAGKDAPIQGAAAVILGETQALVETRGELSSPAIEFNRAGSLYAAWFQRKQGGAELLVSRFEDGRASSPIRANPQDAPPGALHQAPGLAIDRQGRVYVSWTTPKKGQEADFAGDLVLARSSAGGNNFEPPVLVNDDGKPIGHGFETLAVGRGNELYVTWLDNRHKHKSGAGIFFAASADAGQTIGPNVALDGMACPCCRPATAVAPDHGVWQSWRKTFDGNVRDIVFAHAQSASSAFSPPVLVHQDGWIFSACPHRGPSLGFDQTGRLYVAWYTEGADETPRLMFATSDDEGKTFSDPLLLHTAENSLPDQLRMVVHPAGIVVAVWEEITGVRKRVVMRVSTDQGKTFGMVQPISGQAKAQNPTVAIHDSGAVAFSWHEHEWPNNRLMVRWGQVDVALVAGTRP